MLFVKNYQRSVYFKIFMLNFLLCTVSIRVSACISNQKSVLRRVLSCISFFIVYCRVLSYKLSCMQFRDLKYTIHDTQRFRVLKVKLYSGYCNICRKIKDFCNFGKRKNTNSLGNNNRLDKILLINVEGKINFIK